MTRLVALLLVLTTTLAWGEREALSRDFIEGSAKLQLGDFLKARAMAEQMLLLNSNSLEAHCLLGQVQLWGEGNLALADFHLGQSLEFLQDQHPDSNSDRFPAEIHRSLLKDLAMVSFEREEFQRSLELLSEHDRLYSPKLTYRRGWPLMKLGEFTEAEEELHTFRQGLDEFDPLRVRVTDTLGQLDYERGKTQQAESFFEEASLLDSDLSEEPDPVYLCNLGEVQRDLGKFEAATDSWKLATEMESARSYAAPNELLARHYAAQARHNDALAAIEKAHARRHKLHPRVARATQARYLASLGEVLLAAGQSELALSALNLSLELPHRNARNSNRAELEMSKRYVLLAAAHAMEAERRSGLAESKPTDSSLFEMESSLHHLEAQWAFSLAAAYSYRGSGFQSQVRAFGPGSFQAPWLLHHLTSMYPKESLSWAQRSDESGKQIYLACLEASVGDEALIPKEQVLARAVSLALRGQKELALSLDPFVLQRLQDSIGMTVTGSEEVRQYLLESPRLFEGPQLRLDVGADLSARLRGFDGHIDLEILPQDNPEALALAVHTRLFSLHLPWDKNRLKSLLTEPDPKRKASAKIGRLIEQQR